MSPYSTSHCSSHFLQLSPQFLPQSVYLCSHTYYQKSSHANPKPGESLHDIYISVCIIGKVLDSESEKGYLRWISHGTALCSCVRQRQGGIICNWKKRNVAEFFCWSHASDPLGQRSQRSDVLQNTGVNFQKLGFLKKKTKRRLEKYLGGQI